MKARTRLVTIVGAAGVGKTRLALEVARAQAGTFTPLASARSLDDLCRLVGRTLQIDLGGEPDVVAAVERIRAALIARSTGDGSTTLVVLDEVEHLPGACAEALAGWASEGGSLRLLVTSRAALGVAGETVYELLPLRLPAQHEPPADSPAVRLFIDRAGGTAALAGAELHDIAAIVERVEGFPLAIEMAAAMLEGRAFGVLRSSLAELSSEVARDDATGERSLRGAIHSAWRALDATDRNVLAASSVFRGGFTVDALGAVAAIDSAAAQSRINRLRARALVFPLEVAEGVAPRFDLYDSVRRYLATTADSAPALEASRRHRDYFLKRWCDWRVAPELTLAALPALDAEQANLLAVLERSLAEGPSAGAATCSLQVVVALAPLRIGRAPLAEYLKALDAAIGLAGRNAMDASLLVMALIARGRAHALAGRLTTAAIDLERAVAIAEDASGDEWVARASIQLAIVRRDLGDTETALHLFERARSFSQRSGQLRLGAEAAGGLARIAGDEGAPMAQAIELAQQAVALARRAGDLPTAARMECRVGTLLVDVGRHDDAAERFEAARALAADLGLSDVDAIVTINLAVLEHDLGQLAAAEARYRSAVARTRELGLQRLEGGALLLLSLLLLAGDRAGEASTCASESLLAFEGSRDAPYAGLAHVVLGAAFAARGRIEDAAGSIERGNATLERGGDNTVKAAAEVLGALVFSVHAPAARAMQPASGHSAAASASIVRLAIAATAPALLRASSTRMPLRFTSDASSVDLPSGERLDLRSQPQSRRILLTLIDARKQSPGCTVERDALVRAVWPGEELARSTGKNRLHVAMNQLRTLGLRTVVLTRDGGYLLDPELPLVEIEP